MVRNVGKGLRESWYRSRLSQRLLVIKNAAIFANLAAEYTTLSFKSLIALHHFLIGTRLRSSYIVQVKPMGKGFEVPFTYPPSTQPDSFKKATKGLMSGDLDQIF